MLDFPFSQCDWTGRVSPPTDRRGSQTSGSPRPGLWVSEHVSKRWLPSRLLPEASLLVPPTLQPVPRRGPSSPPSRSRALRGPSGLC